MVVRNDLAVIENHHPIAGGFNFAENMGGENDGFLLTDLSDDLPDFDDLIGIEAGCGLI